MGRAWRRLAAAGIVAGVVSAASGAMAVPLTGQNQSLTVQGVTFTLLECHSGVGSTSNGCGTGEFVATAEGGAAGIRLQNTTGGLLQSYNGLATGFVDTFVRFAVTSPLVSLTSFTIRASGSAPTGMGVAQTSGQVFNGEGVGFDPGANFSARTVGTTNMETATFPASASVIVTADIRNAVLFGSGGSSFDWVVFSFALPAAVPEPLGAGLVVLGLAALGWVRRRR